MTIDFKTYRENEFRKQLKQANLLFPLDVMVTGVTGAGKSTTLNIFFRESIAKVGTGVEPETMSLNSYSLNKAFRIWDTPGLGDGVKIDRIHKKKIIDLLYKTYKWEDQYYGWIDLVLVIIEGSNRDMGTTYSLLKEVIIPNIQSERILVLINQADLAMKGRHWNYRINEPDEILIEYLENQAISIQKRIKEATKINICKPIYYSAEYGYHIKEVFDFILNHMPKEKRKLLKRAY